MIEFTRHDAAYGVMMMGYAEDSFAQLRRVLTETSARAQEQRNTATADLLAGLARMRMTFVAARGGRRRRLDHCRPPDRASDLGADRSPHATMAALAEGSVEVEIPDRQRRDEIGAMANAVEVFKENMVKGRRLASEIDISPIMMH